MRSERLARGRLLLFLAALSASLAISLSFHGAANAGPALLFDAADGKVLYAEDQDDPWHPASLTKIMTAYVAFQAIKSGKITKDTKLVVSELAHSQPPSKIGLPIAGTITVELALQALIVKSANDVAVMLAEGIGGTAEEFVGLMNQTAKRLGMTKTLFVNPNGLPAVEQVTTARDLGKLSRAILKEFPEYGALWAQADMRIGRLRLRSHNGLLKTYEGADGLKTGFTCDSGYNVVATATRDGQRLVAVVLGEASGRERNIRAASLLEHGNETSGWSAVLQPVLTIDTMPVDGNSKPAVTSVRANVMNWDCGNRRRRPAPIAKVKQKRPVKQAGVETTVPAGAATAVPAAQGGESVVAPVVKKAPRAPKPPATTEAKPVATPAPAKATN
jgi:D-alanyl-D-alanine carboxypeptidase